MKEEDLIIKNTLKRTQENDAHLSPYACKTANYIKMKEIDCRNIDKVEFVKFLKNSTEKRIIIRTTMVAMGWYDVESCADRAGRRVARVYDEEILRKNGWVGNFAEFYIFTK